MAGRLLTAAGFEVVGEAADGPATLRAVDELAPDLVLLDVQLSTEDGIDISRQLSRGTRPPDVVLVSSREASDYGSRLTDAPILGFISKRAFSGAALGSLIAQA